MMKYRFLFVLVKMMEEVSTTDGPAVQLDNSQLSENLSSVSIADELEEAACTDVTQGII